MMLQGAVHRLVASQYKIAPDKLMRTGNINSAMGEQSLSTRVSHSRELEHELSLILGPVQNQILHPTRY